MKKLVAISVLFALLTGAAFAEVTFSGSVQSGFRLGFGDSYPNGEFSIRDFDVNGGARVNLNGAFTHSSGTAGGAFQIRADWTGLSTGPVFQNRNAWLWFQPMDILRIHIGRIDGDGFGTGSRVDTHNGVGGNGAIAAHLRFTPIDGLRVGLTFLQESAALNTLKTPDIAFGFAYTMANTFRAVASARIVDLGAEKFQGMMLGFGLNILALADMGFSAISFDAEIGSLTLGLGKEGNDNAPIAIGQRITFATGGLTITEELRVDMGGSITKDEMAIRVRLDGSYKIDTITAGVGFGLGINRTQNGTDPRPWDGTNGAFTKDYMLLIVNPYLTFPLGGPNVTMGYSIAVGMPKTGDAVINNAIYATASISF